MSTYDIKKTKAIWQLKRNVITIKIIFLIIKIVTKIPFLTNSKKLSMIIQLRKKAHNKWSRQ